MRRRGRGTLAAIVAATLLLALSAAACTDGGPSPTFSATNTTATTGAEGPTISPGPVGTAAAVHEWVVRWVRGFITLGQEVDEFRQAVRNKDQEAIATTARPIGGAAAQVSAGITVGGPFPEPIDTLASLALETLGKTQRQSREVVRACPGEHCLETAQAMYDLTDVLLDGFRTIFRTAGIPVPEAS